MKKVSFHTLRVSARPTRNHPGLATCDDDPGRIETTRWSFSERPLETTEYKYTTAIPSLIAEKCRLRWSCQLTRRLVKTDLGMPTLRGSSSNFSSTKKPTIRRIHRDGRVELPGEARRRRQVRNLANESNTRIRPNFDGAWLARRQRHAATEGPNKCVVNETTSRTESERRARCGQAIGGQKGGSVAQKQPQRACSAPTECKWQHGRRIGSPRMVLAGHIDAAHPRWRERAPNRQRAAPCERIETDPRPLAVFQGVIWGGVFWPRSCQIRRANRSC